MEGGVIKVVISLRFSFVPAYKVLVLCAVAFRDHLGKVADDVVGNLVP